ncbi:hypothetical protein E2C01_047847 [Portunus trituberculatus]|uniref:RNase H type-1 domain-containing protein n=1 Tax=Portunus trituberculatus TaxID=210409 RepID=A0A5B7GBM2_PORTR|nr:hypothetical protein [Portunus trituberculatus]
MSPKRPATSPATSPSVAKKTRKPLTLEVKLDIIHRWDDVVADEEVKGFMEETVCDVRRNDPVHRRWDVKGWLRKEDSCHINLVKLDTAIKGLNLAVAWQVKKLELLRDSSTVHCWITDGLSGRTRLKTKAASEMLIKRRVGIVLMLVEEYGLQLTVSLLISSDNKADSLTCMLQ